MPHKKKATRNKNSKLRVEDMREWLSGFACFLRTFGYNTTSEDAFRALRMANSVSSADELDDILSLFFAKTQEQAAMIPYYRKKFDANSEREIQSRKGDIGALSKLRDSEGARYSSEIETIRKEKLQAEKIAASKILQKINDENTSLALPLASSDLNDMDRAEQSMLEPFLVLSERLGETPMRAEQHEGNPKKGDISSYELTQFDFEAMQKALAEALTRALWNADLDAATRIESAIKMLDSSKRNVNEANKLIDKAMKEAGRPFEEKISEIEQQSKEAKAAIQKEIAQKQRELDDLLRKDRELQRESFTPAFKQKQISKIHREQDNYRSATQCLDDGTTCKKLTSLSEKERKDIYNALRRNAVALYTRMTRNIKTKLHAKIDMPQTIKQTCKTGGIPYNIIKIKPKPSKARMVLVLDISGSCAAASKMMLTLMHALAEVFPRGVKVYVFVNRIYDVSEIMRSNNVHQAVNEIFDLVPTRGVYSDYNEPLRSLWEDHRQDITKDTMCVFIGDARNNRNPSGESYAKNIARKAKRSYWLNTEPRCEWDTGDSIAATYGKYMQMVPVITASDIIKFIEDMR